MLALLSALVAAGVHPGERSPAGVGRGADLARRSCPSRRRCEGRGPPPLRGASGGGPLAATTSAGSATSFRALAEPDARSRDALVDEQLLELDWAARRWARVPRVCASIATSAGFLFGSLALLQGSSYRRTRAPRQRSGQRSIAALNALAVGIAGTAFCVAVHVRARRVVERARRGRRAARRCPSGTLQRSLRLAHRL